MTNNKLMLIRFFSLPVEMLWLTCFVTEGEKSQLLF